MTSDLRYQIFMTTRRGRSMDREGDRLTEVLKKLVGYHPLFNSLGLPSTTNKNI